MTQKFQYITTGLLVIAGILVGTLSLNPPADFPTGVAFEVKEGETMHSVSSRLKDEHVIISATLFRGWISLLGKDKKVGLGVYNFDKPASLGSVVSKFVQGPDEPLLSVTIPEGFTTVDIAAAFKKAIPSLSVSSFLELVRREGLNGYLFPSTYYPLPSYTEEDITAKMKATFDKEFEANFQNAIFPKVAPTVSEVLSLAAILEGEAKTPEDMKVVAGILEKRLSQGMRLQVDVASSTYTSAGLPKIPIANPGLTAIDAVFRPTLSQYLYYLTGKDGTMHYSKTFEEHKKNIEKYLR
jgi:UPF0755 protein